MQLTPNVFVEDRFSSGQALGGRGCCISFVTTSEGIVMIDGPMLPTDAIKYREMIAQKGELRYLINTDFHTDHITHNYYFPGTVVSHEGIRKMFFASLAEVVAEERVDEAVQNYKTIVDWMRVKTIERDPEGLHLMDNYELRPPTITFSEQMTLYVGKHTFELMHLPGHTPYHIGVYVPEEEVFFTGDNFGSATQPAMSHAMPLEWVESLKKIEAKNAKYIVPGHGRVAGNKELREFRIFIERCIALVQDAIKQGMTKEEAADRLSFLELRPAVHPDPKMQRRNVSRLYEMLSKKTV